MATLKPAIPVLRVYDVSRTLSWYKEMLGFSGDPFPAEPPYQFAILRNGACEIMLQRGELSFARLPHPYQWSVYIPVSDGDIRELFKQLSKAGVVTRRLEKMFYGVAEFEIADPDGYVICLGQELADMSDLPTPQV